MRRSWKVLRAILIVLLIVVLVTPLAGWLLLRRSLPQVSGTARLAGIAGAVQIVRDSYGIPYIYAESDHDAVFALGYVHAQDRLWQMEMQRRIGAGRLSEVLGKAPFKTDQFLRTLGVYRAAESAWTALDPATQALLQAYTDGVNAYLGEGHPLPPEFVVLGFEPEPWKPADSLVWAKMMAWNLGSTYGNDLYHMRLAAALGPERARQLAPGYPADGPIILPPDAMTSDLREINNTLRDVLGLGDRQNGSNNWVVSGARTASGKPMLANDPHLGAQIPAIWYLAGIQGDKLHAVGATLPGLPAVVIGHNEDVAWGVTNLGPDVQDLFAEKINPANPGQYEVNGMWVDIEVYPSEIKVKGEKKPIQWAARATRNGPLISDVTDERGYALSLRWTSLDPGDTTMRAFLGINYARNWTDFTEALKGYVAPSQNFVFADRAGNIGYYGPGRIPVRAKGDGSVPVPGWTDEYAWKGWIPFDQLPHAYNPQDGFLVTANNKVVPDSYPYFLTYDWAPPYRAARITELLTAKTGLTPDDSERIQADQVSTQVRELLPFMLAVQPETPEQAQALDLLRAWDGTISRDSGAAAIYEAWDAQLYMAFLGDDVGGSLGEDIINDQDSALLRRIVAGDQGAWCDNVLTPEREDCAATARAALDDALEDLIERMGKTMARWRWGDIHRTQFPHNPFSQVSFLKPLFHRSIETGGDRNTVNPAPFKLEAPYDSQHLPSYRQIIDLADFNTARFVQTTGQSGNVFSRHYADLMPIWRDVKYVPMYWEKEKLLAGGVTFTLTLEPAALAGK